MYFGIANATTTVLLLRRLFSVYRQKINSSDGLLSGLRSRIMSLYHNISFPSFVAFLVDHYRNETTLHNMDTHLRPQVVDCDYCSINYTFVAKSESFQKNLDFILSKAGVPEEFHRVPDFQKRDHGRAKPSDINATYSELSSRLKRGLKEFYFYDFEMFGYDANKYD